MTSRTLLNDQELEAADTLRVQSLAIGFLRRSRGWGSSVFNVSRVIARDIQFEVAAGQSLVILGPNGAGKTTLLRTILGLMPQLSGSVLVGGLDTRACSIRERARLLAYVPQSQELGFGFRVRDLVAMGRAPFLPPFALPSRNDLKIADAVLERLGIRHLTGALATEMSGGEQRMMLIARALVQEPRFLLLDEPTANLDYANQARVLRQLAALSQSGLGIVMNSHSPGHAFACGTNAALLDRDGRFTIGTVAEMVTEERLSVVYGVAVRIVTVATEEGPMQTCVPELKSR